MMEMEQSNPTESASSPDEQVHAGDGFSKNGSDCKAEDIACERYSPDRLKEIDLERHNDISLASKMGNRRQRQEFPQGDLPLLKTMIDRERPYDLRVLPALNRVVYDAMHSFGYISDRHMSCCDSSLLSWVRYDWDHMLPSIVAHLYWEARLQSAHWKIFQLLVEHGHLTYATSLAEPMQLSGNIDDEKIHCIFHLLHCFEAMNGSLEVGCLSYSRFKHCPKPGMWLGIAIARGCNDINGMFALLEKSGLVGRLHDPKRFNETVREMNAKGIVIDKNPKRGSIQARDSKYYHPFGFWLPKGLGTNENLYPNRIRHALRRFNRVEEVYKRFFQVPGEELLLEGEEDEWFRAHPECTPQDNHNEFWPRERTPSPEPLFTEEEKEEIWSQN